MKKKELNFSKKGFDQDSFMRYMESTYTIDNFGRALMLNLIDYAHEHEHVSKDMFAEFLSDLIPEVDFRDVAAFCEDCVLTTYGIQQKELFWEEHGE